MTPQIPNTIGDTVCEDMFSRFNLPLSWPCLFFSLFIFWMFTCFRDDKMHLDFLVSIPYFAFSGVHVTMEALIKDNELISTIKDLVRSSGRSYPAVQAEKLPSQESAAVAGTENQKMSSSKDKVHPAASLNGVPQKEIVAVR